jgi:hypothetical protein
MAASEQALAGDGFLAGSYRRPFRRSLTRDFLGQDFSEQARIAEAAAAASEAAKQDYERQVEVAFSDAVSTRKSTRWRVVGAAIASAATAAAYLFF